MRDRIEALVRTAIDRCLADGRLPLDPGAFRDGRPPVAVEVPRQKAHGDFATNAAMVLAGLARQAAGPGQRPPAPRAIAEALAAEIRALGRELVASVEVAGPGFLNLVVSDDAWRAVLREAVRAGARYGAADVGRGARVQVEFVSANPTGPLHVGAARNAAVGDALANLLAFAGYRVWREYYINDYGSQIELLGRSVYVRYAERFGRRLPMPEEGYHGEYIRELAAEIAEADGPRHLDRPEAEVAAEFAERAVARLLEAIRRDLDDFGVRFDAWFSERSLYAPGARGGGVEGALAALRRAGHVYEQDGALWFRSSAFGDDKDRVVVRADGRPTYFASDIAYTKDKYERGFDRLYFVWGADHHGYVPRMKAVARALGRDPDTLRVTIIQLVRLVRGGVEVKMSKRAGEYTTLRDLLDEVGRDAARFFLLMRRADAPLDFDLELAKRQEADNPVYYVQYAHARIASVLRLAAERGVPVPGPDDADLRRLTDPDELDLARAIAAFPALVEDCARSEEPHHVTFYLQDLAGRFHAYYNRVRILESDPALAAARLLLARAVQVALRNGLALLGVSAPERMAREGEGTAGEG
ncbi:MAG TPA: arginine--tRNA ligase [Thermodesulfobacteriota bacterium]|nr:arginine--tRNA ligase [Thermodesulfobacteriota bacterium]